MNISIPPWCIDIFWKDHPDGDMEFWAVSKQPKCNVGDTLYFKNGKNIVASAVIYSIEPPNQSACTTTGKYENKWKIFWRKADFKDLRHNVSPNQSSQLQ